jgi:oligopeptide transport system substrate-binding protein
MKKSKFLLFLAFSLIVSAFLAACGGGEEAGDSDDGGTKDNKDVPQELGILESAEIPSMDSVLAQDSLSFTTLNAVNEGLYRLGKNQEVIPGVAAGEPEVSEDGTVYTIKLKEDVKWSNDDPVTAHDFVFAYQRALNPDVASPYGPYMMIGKIKNADKVYEGSVEPSELGAKALDDYTLEITLERPLPFFESLLTFQTFYPQNQKYVEEQGADYAKDSEHLLYNGPFKLVDWDGPQGTTWGYVKNEDYWDAENVSLENVTFNVSKDAQSSANAFEAGEADITPKLGTPSVISQYEGSDELLRFLEPSIWWLKMNEENPALQNENIRRAIALTVDKKALVDDVLQNGSIVADFIVPKEFANGPGGKDFRETAGTYLETNKEEAKKLWEKGLKEIGKSELTFTYVGQDTEASKTTDAFMKDQLEKNLPGLKINVESVPFSIRLDREDKQDYDLLMGGWGPDYLDPMTYLDLWVTDGPQNKMSFSDPKFDEIIQKARVDLSTKPEERWKALQEAEKVLLEDNAALAPLYQRTVNKLVAGKVKGLVHHATSGDYSLQWVTIEE